MEIAAKAGKGTLLSEDVRAVLSLREAVVLADVAEKVVRKDIEANVIAPIRAGERPCFRWHDVFFLAAVYRTGHLDRHLRKLVFQKLEALVGPAYRRDLFARRGAAHMRLLEKPSQLVLKCDRVEIDKYLFIDFERVLNDVAPRVDLYAAGLTRIEEEKEGVSGGETVFKNTRLPVRHVGKMYAGGEPLEMILSDYPYLSGDDVTFARLFAEAHPIVGRPRTSGAADDEWHSVA